MSERERIGLFVNDKHWPSNPSNIGQERSVEVVVQFGW
jgi:hypothetical protein